MELEQLTFEVQRIDDTPASMIRAIDLLIGKTLQIDYLPQSIERGFFEEFSKRIVEWMATGKNDLLKEVWEHTKQVVQQDNNLAHPFAGSNSKIRVGALFLFMKDLIEVYLRSDMELKDRLLILGVGDQRRQYRQLIIAMLELGGSVDVGTLVGLRLYRVSSPRTIRKRLDELVWLNFVRKTIFPTTRKKIVYELTNKARSLRKEIEKMT